MKIADNSTAGNAKVEVSLTLKNTGKRLGKEVVQLYIRDKHASMTRPVKELKGFELVTLEMGESKQLSFTLTNKELGFYTNDGDYVVEPGEFEVFVGGSSEDTISTSFNLKL